MLEALFLVKVHLKVHLKLVEVHIMGHIKG